MASPTVEIDLHKAIWDRLAAITGINTYDGTVPDTPPPDQDGRVHAYAVLWMSPGARVSTTLGGRQGRLYGSCDVTCAGGDVSRTLACISKVRANLPGLVTVDGQEYRLWLREVDPGAPVEDLTVKPSRFRVLLELQIFIP